jgi:hypothetical protein
MVNVALEESLAFGFVLETAGYFDKYVSYRKLDLALSRYIVYHFIE